MKRDLWQQLRGRTAKLLNPPLEETTNRMQYTPPSRRQIAGWLLLIFLAGALALRDYDNVQVGLYGDDSYYVVLAQSIVTSDVYGPIHAPSDLLPPIQFPFGYPLLLAPFVALFPGNMTLLKLTSLAANLISASLLFWGWPWLSQVKSYWWALGIAVLTTFANLTFFQTRAVMSEPVFLTFTLAALILTEHLTTGAPRRVWLVAALLGILIVWTVFIRIIGVTLLAAVVARLLLQARRKALLPLAGFAGGGAAFLLLVVLFTPIEPRDFLPRTYVSTFDEIEAEFLSVQADLSEEEDVGILARVSRTFALYAGNVVRRSLSGASGFTVPVTTKDPIDLTDPQTLISLGVFGLVTMGLLAFTADRGLAVSVLLFLAFYAAALLAWPWALNRFLYPTLPFLYFSFLMGIKMILTIIGRLRFRPLGVECWTTGAVALVGIFLLFQSLRADLGKYDSREDFYNMAALGGWFAHNTPPDAVVMSWQPQTIYLYSNRKTLDHVPFKSLEEFDQTLRYHGVDYLLALGCYRTSLQVEVCDPWANEMLIPTADALVEVGRLRRVYESQGKDKVVIYEVIQ